MDSGATPVRAQKLKDSCDPCSESKVRCDKKKPTCARCLSLNRPCCYSPARRAGRPYRVRGEKNAQSSSATPLPNSSHPTETAGNLEPSSDTSVFGDLTLLATHTEMLDHTDQRQHPAEHPAAQPAQTLAYQDPGDCSATVVAILEQLDMAGRRSDHRRPSMTTTDICQRLLTILICPCSEQPDVALLVASGCISLMDTVRHLDAATATPSPGENMFSWPNASSSHNSVGSGQCEVERLAKVAKVVLKFTEKYSQVSKGGGGWAHTTWVVAPIVTLLRSRLQSVTHEATGRLIL